MSAFEGFEPIFGAAQAQLSSTTTHSALPFLFRLRAQLIDDRLEIHVTDFHAYTWNSDMSTDFLEDLVVLVRGATEGRSGNWRIVGRYVRDVFASENVKIHLKGSVHEGATAASLSGQKAERSPKLRLNLVKLQGAAASDAMASISVQMFQVFRSQAASLASESARAAQMSTAYMQEKARADVLQEKLDALSFTNKKKSRSRPTLSVDDATLLTQSIVASQFATPSVFEDLATQGAKAPGSSGQMDPPKAKPAAKVGLAGPRLRAAPIVRRPKRRATVDSDDDDN